MGTKPYGKMTERLQILNVEEREEKTEANLARLAQARGRVG
jgi:hypothetical protein